MSRVIHAWSVHDDDGRVVGSLSARGVKVLPTSVLSPASFRAGEQSSPDLSPHKRVVQGSLALRLAAESMPLGATAADVQQKQKKTFTALVTKKNSLVPIRPTYTARRPPAQADRESAKLRVHCASQQALVGSLDEATRNRARLLSPGTTTGLSQPPPPPTNSAAPPPPGGAPQRRQGGRVSALRSLVEKLREGGVGAHGLLADLVLLRRRCDETAVMAVFGSALRDTVVVQTRADGARVVAEARKAGIIQGRIRCDVLDEVKGGGRATGSSGKRGGGEGPGSGLSSLSECVATSDPRHLPAAEKRLRGWYACGRSLPPRAFRSCRCCCRCGLGLLTLQLVPAVDTVCRRSLRVLLLSGALNDRRCRKQLFLPTDTRFV